MSFLAYDFIKNYDPANIVPKIPTANSIQIKINTIIIETQTITLFRVIFNFLNVYSQINAVQSSKIPATAKSKIVQLTSFVNCIAIKGISNIIKIEIKIIISLFFCIIV